MVFQVGRITNDLHYIKSFEIMPRYQLVNSRIKPSREQHALLVSFSYGPYQCYQNRTGPDWMVRPEKIGSEIIMVRSTEKKPDM
jgi:hypothetical protein